MSIQPIERRSNWSYDNLSNGTATGNASYWIVAKEKYVRRKRNRVEKNRGRRALSELPRRNYIP